MTALVTAPGSPRIVMVVAQYPPTIGGLERACQRLSRALAERGARVTVLTRRAPGAPRLAVEDGVVVRRFRVPPGRIAAGIVFVARALGWLLSHSGDHDVVHCHQLLSPAMIGALARRVTGRPVLVKLACSGATGDVALIRLHRFASFRRAVLGGAIDGCICLNEEMERELTDWLGPVRTWRMPNGVDVRSFAPPPREERAEMRRRFGFEGRVVLFTGVLRPQKSLPLAVEAISRLPSDVHLWIVGDGPERRRLERFVTGKGLSSRVHLAGSTEDVRPYLHAADAYVLPSTAEGMSNSLLEAMAAGLPAVASDVPGNRDVSGEGRCAALFAPGDVDSLTGALRVLVDDPIRARELARAGQERALAEYDLAGVADRYLAVYRELTNRSRLRGS